MQSVSKSFLAALFVSVAVLSTPASAETIQGALSKAYQNNSKLNSARAGVRVTDEGVAIAKSGYRPTIAGSASIDYSTTRRKGAARRGHAGQFRGPDQPDPFDGIQTKNNVAGPPRAARVGIGRKACAIRRRTPQFAAQSYKNVIHDRQVDKLTEQNLKAQTEQVRAGRVALRGGEGPRNRRRPGRRGTRRNAVAS